MFLTQEGSVSGRILVACRDRCKTDLWAFNDYKVLFTLNQGVPKRRRLSWLASSVLLVYEPK
jgi:hypothetical protein